MNNYKVEYLLDFLKEGITQYHVVEKVKTELVAAGYKELDLNKDFGRLDAGKYYVKPYMSCIFAFVIPENAESVRIAASHTDFPMLKIKAKPDMVRDGYLMADVENYGGLILSSWFDRPLGVAGKVVRKGSSHFKPEVTLFDSKEPLFVMPNLAPHMRRDKKGEDYDVAKEIVPLYAMKNDDAVTINKILGISDALSYDLYLYNMDEPKLVGYNKEFILSPRIDNVSSVSAVTEVMINESTDGNSIKIGAYFDNEEIGSRTKQGADSVIFSEIMERIINAAAKDEDNKMQLKNNAFIMSLDVAHALHPNYSEKNDKANSAFINKGVVLKMSSSQRYVTDSEASAVIIDIAKENDVKLQLHTNKSGMPGGQTLGPIISSYVPSLACDMGIPLLAMHSAAETAGKDDYIELCKLVESVFDVR